MNYTPPVNEQRFLLRHVVQIHELAGDDTFAAATPDLVDAIIDEAGRFAAKEFAPLNRKGDEIGARWSAAGVSMPEGFKQAYSAYVESGWATLAAQVEDGGQGLPLTLNAVVMEDLSSANLAFSLLPMLTTSAVETLKHHGSNDLKALWFSKLVSGEWSGTMNLTEPQAGSDVGALKTKAELAPDGTYLISGTKIFITFGEHDLTDNIVHLVLARTADSPSGTKGISLFLVPKILPDGRRNDLRCVSIEDKLGIHASPTCVMSFGDNGQCTGWLIGEAYGGMRAMFTMMNKARLAVGLEGVAIAERATQAAVAYAQQRVQGRRNGQAVAIIEHPDVRRMLLRMMALTQAARALCYYAYGQVDRASLGDGAAKLRADLLTPLVKAYCTDIGVEVASLGVQVHGGMGYIEETGAAQHFRDARIAPIYEGTNGIQAADLVGRKIGLDEGEVLAQLVSDIRSEAAGYDLLMELVDRCEHIGRRLRAIAADDAMAAAYPFLIMLSVAASGWMMARQLQALNSESSAFADRKRAAVRYYLEQVVPEAIGLHAQATAPAAVLYSMSYDVIGP